MSWWSHNPVARFLSRHAFPIFYVLGFAVVVVTLYTVNRLFWSDFDWNWRDIVDKPQLVGIYLNNIADALILMLPLLLLPARRRGWQWLVLVLLLVWSVVQVLYHPHYLDIMPYSMFVMFQNVTPVSINSAVGTFRLGQLHLVVWSVLLLLFYVLFLHRGVKQYRLRRRWLWVGLSLLAFVAIRLFNPVCVFYSSEQERYSDKMLECYTVSKGHTDLYFKHNGLVSYTLFSFGNWLRDQRKLSDSEKATVDAFVADNPHYTDNVWSAGNDNLIIIIVESLNSWVVDLRIDGREVTPTLNRLCHDPASLYAPHMKTQVKNGHSSDGQFMYITGLLPLTTAAVSMAYPEADYPSIFKAMPQHLSLLIGPDNTGMWNLEKMSKSFGVKQLHAKVELAPYIEANDFHADRAVMKYALDTLSALSAPFVAVVKTIDMHSPFDRLSVDTTWISQSRQYTPAVRNYLELTAYFDRQLGEFLDSLATTPLAGNTVIAIMGDHSERVDNDPAGRPAIDPDGDETMLLVLNPGLESGMKKQECFGQIDVYPTLLDLMGGNAYHWKGMGNSLLRNDVRSVVTAPGQVKGDTTSPLVPRQQAAWEVSELMIMRHYLPAAH